VLIKSVQETVTADNSDTNCAVQLDKNRTWSGELNTVQAGLEADRRKQAFFNWRRVPQSDRT